MAKKSEFSTVGRVYTIGRQIMDDRGIERTMMIRVSTHHRHSPWSDCESCLTKHRRERRQRNRRERASRRTNRG